MASWGVDAARLRGKPIRHVAIIGAVLAFHVVAIAALSNWFSHGPVRQLPALIRVAIYPDRPAAPGTSPAPAGKARSRNGVPAAANLP